MKPFNPERALAGDPVVTRDGREVKDLRHLPSSTVECCRVVAVVNGRVKLYYESGRASPENVWDSPDDLFMAPKKRTVWVNLYDDGGHCAFWHNSEQKADEGAASDSRIGGRAFPIEIEE